MFKNLRIGILNWLGAGRIRIEQDKPQEYKMSSTYTIGGGGGYMGKKKPQGGVGPRY